MPTSPSLHSFHPPFHPPTQTPRTSSPSCIPTTPRMPTTPSPATPRRRGSSTLNMIHKVKVNLSGICERNILATDQRLREADVAIAQLQRWFPQLQVSVDENEKTWATLSFNIRSVARHAQEIYDPDHPLQYMLDHLHAAGDSVRPPSREHALSSERGRASAQLRAFNERIREVRVLQNECVQAFREKEYYNAKVENIRVSEMRKKKLSERDIEKRIRNETKLTDFGSSLSVKWEQLQRELEDVEACKESVLELVLLAFARTQDYYFSRNPIGPTLALFKTQAQAKGSGSSPTCVNEGDGAFDAHRRGVCEENADERPTAPPPSEAGVSVGRGRGSNEADKGVGVAGAAGAAGEAGGSASLYAGV